MALRLRRLKEISRFVIEIYSGANGFQSSKGGINLLYSHSPTSHNICTKVINAVECGSFHGHRYSAMAKRKLEPPPEADLLSFILSALDKLQGPSHCWLNKNEVSRCFLDRDGIFIILAGKLFGDALVPGSNTTAMFENVKLLQQRYPSLQIMGFQYNQSISSDAVSTDLTNKIMIEYITFPILISNKYFSEMKDGACYIMFKGFHNPLIYHAEDVDFLILEKALNVLIKQHTDRSKLANKLESTWVIPRSIKEPYLSFYMRNLLLYFPGCISVDEGGNRLFLSDINHHRIIIFDNNGKILDCIGSSPGFEDAEFENAKLKRPAASLYHASDDSLYFVDSENHAIRRADMKRRVVETIFRTNTVEKFSTLWSWILDKLGIKRDAGTKYTELDPDSLLFPWHLLKPNDNDLFILNRSFGTLWIMDLTSGIIREVVKGFPNILEICGEMIKDQATLMKHMPDNWLPQQMNTSPSLDGIPHAGLMSSIVKFKDDVVICDAVGQMLWRLDMKSGSTSSFQLSNFGILGFPYWCSFPLEKVFAAEEAVSEIHIDHVQSFCLLPGRVTVVLNIDIPEDVILVEPLEEKSVWCHARGSAIEVSGAEGKASSSEKVGVAQQWYDEIDNLTLVPLEIDSNMEVQTKSSNGKVEEGTVRIRCFVSTSPGTSEVIIYVPLYLKLKSSSSTSDGQSKNAARLSEILDPIGWAKRDSLIQFLLRSNNSLHDLVFVKPLHVRLKFDCGQYPNANNLKNVILTDSSIDVKVAF